MVNRIFGVLAYLLTVSLLCFAITPYEHLKELEWMIGDWVDQDPDVEILLKHSFDKSKNYINGTFSLTSEGRLELSGTQIFAFDPIKQKIRSWFFNSDREFREATWTKKEKSFIAEIVQTLANGSLASAINVYTPIDSDSYSWQSTGWEVGGQILPDIEPIKIVKKKV